MADKVVCKADSAAISCIAAESIKDDRLFQKIRKANPDIPIYRVTDKEFLPYGRILQGYDVSEIIRECGKITVPATGSRYEPSILALEELAIAGRLRKECFGEMEIQVGLCWGHNKLLNGLEYHKSSEINIAVTPMLLLLGRIYEMDGMKFNAKNIKGFYAEKGQVIEVYGTSLHFCPCEVKKEGFSSVVGLHKGTNEPLDAETNEPLLFRKNKWLICHEENDALIGKGVYPGIYGENFEIKYI